VAVILYFHLTLHFLNPFVQANYDFVNSYNVAVQDMMVSQFELLEPLPSCQLQSREEQECQAKVDIYLVSQCFQNNHMFQYLSNCLEGQQDQFL